MNRKHWPYWVKGGVIGFLAVVVFTWLNFQNPPAVFCKIGGPCPTAWENFISGEYLVLILYFVIPAILIGGFLGWLYGKIKKHLTPTQ